MRNAALKNGKHATADARADWRIGACVASDGVSALAFQSAPVSTSSETDLVGVIVNPDGTYASPVTLTPWTDNQYSPRATWDGIHYVVVYNDQVNRFAPFTLNEFNARSDFFGMRVAANGSKIDPMGFVFSASDAAESWTSVAAGNGMTLFAGSVMLNQGLDAYRLGYQLRGANGNQWQSPSPTRQAVTSR